MKLEEIKDVDDFIKWCIHRHEITNHYYDEYLPYEFHLRLVDKVDNQFSEVRSALNLSPIVTRCANFGHDIIDDARTTYSKVLSALRRFLPEKEAVLTAEIIFALSNLKGRNRSERGGYKYYSGIVLVKGAAYNKCCDRIANVEYGLLTQSDMVDIYREEHEQFAVSLGTSKETKPMFDYLQKLLFSK